MIIKLVSLPFISLIFIFLQGVVAYAGSGTDRINTLTTESNTAQLSKVSDWAVEQKLEPYGQAQSSTSLKGSIHGLHLLGQNILNRIGNTTEDLKKTCLVIMNELAMPQSISATGPNVVGTMIIPAAPNPGSATYIGHGDPHMGPTMAAINMLIEHSKHLEDEISTTVVPAEAAEYAKELWDKIREISEKMYADLNDLARLAGSKGAEYETLKMEKFALRIYDKSDAINKLRRRIAEELRKQK